MQYISCKTHWAFFLNEFEYLKKCQNWKTGDNVKMYFRSIENLADIFVRKKCFKNWDKVLERKKWNVRECFSRASYTKNWKGSELRWKWKGIMVRKNWWLEFSSSFKLARSVQQINVSIIHTWLRPRASAKS